MFKEYLIGHCNALGSLTKSSVNNLCLYVYTRTHLRDELDESCGCNASSVAKVAPRVAAATAHVVEQKEADCNDNNKIEDHFTPHEAITRSEVVLLSAVT